MMRKITVEECEELNATALAKWLRVKFSSPLGDSIAGTFSVGPAQFTAETEDLLALDLDGHDTQYISFISDWTQFGERRWFLCPYSFRPSCPGRCRKLYLPPGASQFACRTCHHLTYASCQRSREAPLDNFIRRATALLNRAHAKRGYAMDL